MSTRDSATEAGPPGSPEPDGEASYLNALLTTIAKGPRAEIILTWGMGVPDLLPLAADPEELEWIDTLPFRYAQLDGRKVIALVLSLASVKFYQFWKRKGEFKAILALRGDQQVHLRFMVERFKSPEGATQLTIKKATSAEAEDEKGR